MLTAMHDALDRLPARALARADGPLYRQLADLLRAPILAGAFPVGGELPKEAELADRFGVSLITVRQALARPRGRRPDPQAPGQARRRRRPHPTATLGWNFSRFTDMAAFTADAALAIRSWRSERCPAAQRHFALPAATALPCLRSILHAGGHPKAQVTTWFPPTSAPASAAPTSTTC